MEVPKQIEAPEGIEFRISEIDPTQMGTWSTKVIPKETFLGPYVGDITRDGDENSINYRFAWEIFNLENGEYLYTINAKDPGKGNWMRYVNCARYLEEQNLVSVQKDMEMFYKAIKDIEPGEELLTWYQPFKKRRKKKIRSPLKSPTKIVSLPDEDSQEGDTSSQSIKGDVVSGKRQRVKKKMYDDIILMSDLIPKRKRRSKAEIQAEKDSLENYDGNLEDFKEETPKKRKYRKKSSKDSPELIFANNETIPETNLAAQKNKGRKKSTEFSSIEKNSLVESLSDMESSGSSERMKQTRCDLLISKPKTNEEKQQLAEIEAAWSYPKPVQEYRFEHLASYAVTKNGRNFYKCNVCSGIYRHTFSLKRHFLRNHINCRYLSKADLANCLVVPAQQWLDVTHVNDESVLNLCLEKLKSGTELIEVSGDVSSITAPGLYRCCICNKLFDILKDLIDHTQDHPAMPHQKFFGCDQCKMRFTFHQNLLRHKLVHEDGGKKVKKRKDKNPPAVMGHFNMDDIHGKPYKCRLCPMKFRYQSNLEKHHLIHTADRPFYCSVCGKTFPNETNLKKHMVIHVGSSVHCKYCIQKFRHVGTLRKHIRLVHPIKHKERMLNLLVNRNQSDSEAAHKLRKSIQQLIKSENLSQCVPAKIDNTTEILSENTGGKVTKDDDTEDSSKFKFACVICKKRFSVYVNMCRHRRMAHREYMESADLKESGKSENGNKKVVEVKTEMKSNVGPAPQSGKHEKTILKPKDKAKNVIKEPVMEESPESIQEFYANVASNIADNLNCYLDGGLDSLNDYKSYISIEDYDNEPEVEIDEDDTLEKEDLKWEHFNFPPNYNPKVIYENFQYIENRYENEIKPESGRLDRTVLEELAPALCTRRRSSSEWIAFAEFNKNDSNHGDSPLVKESVANDDECSHGCTDKIDLTDSNDVTVDQSDRLDKINTEEKCMDGENVNKLENNDKIHTEEIINTGKNVTHEEKGCEYLVSSQISKVDKRIECSLEIGHSHGNTDMVDCHGNTDMVDCIESKTNTLSCDSNNCEEKSQIICNLIGKEPVKTANFRPGDVIKHGDLDMKDLQTEGQLISTQETGISLKVVNNNGKINQVLSQENVKCVSSQEIKDDVSSQEIKDDVSSQEIKDDVSSQEIKNDVSSQEIKDDVSSQEIKNDVSSQEIKDDVSSQEIKDDVSSQEIKNDVSSQEIKNDVSSQEIKDDVSTQQLFDMVLSQEKRESMKNQQSDEGTAHENIKEKGMETEQSEEGTAHENIKEGMVTEQSEEGTAHENIKEGMVTEQSEEGTAHENIKEGMETKDIKDVVSDDKETEFVSNEEETVVSNEEETVVSNEETQNDSKDIKENLSTLKIDSSDKDIETGHTTLDSKEKDCETQAKCELKPSETQAKCESVPSETQAKCESKQSEIQAGYESISSETQAKCKSKPSETQAKCESKPSETQAKFESKPSETQAKCESKPSETQAKCKSKPSETQAKCESVPSETQAKCESVQLEQQTKCESKPSETQAKFESKPSETQAKCESVQLEQQTKCESNLSDEIQAGYESMSLETQGKCESMPLETQVKCESYQSEKTQAGFKSVLTETPKGESIPSETKAKFESNSSEVTQSGCDSKLPETVKTEINTDKNCKVNDCDDYSTNIPLCDVKDNHIINSTLPEQMIKKTDNDHDNSKGGCKINNEQDKQYVCDNNCDMVNASSENEKDSIKIVKEILGVEGKMQKDVVCEQTMNNTEPSTHTDLAYKLDTSQLIDKLEKEVTEIASKFNKNECDSTLCVVKQEMENSVVHKVAQNESLTKNTTNLWTEEIQSEENEEKENRLEITDDSSVQNNDPTSQEDGQASRCEKKTIVDGSVVSESSGILSIDLFTESDNEVDNIFSGLSLSRRNSAHDMKEMKVFESGTDTEHKQHSPFHNYDDIQFGKNGSVCYICSVCKKQFYEVDRVLRHQWKKHPSIHCHYLQVEHGNEIEYLFYSEPRNRGILGITGKALERVGDRGSYNCTRCSGSFKSVDRLRIHIINCAPKVEGSAESSENKPKFKKRYRKHRKILIKSAIESPVKIRKQSVNSEYIVTETPSKTRKQYLQGPKNTKNVEIVQKMEPEPSKPTRRKKSAEMGYNPHNHIRRRELTELLDTHQCKGCGVKFKSISLLERHVKKCDGKEKFKDLKVMKSNVNDTFHQKLKHACLYCNRGFSYPKTLMNHYKAFCLVKKDKVSKGLLTDGDKQQELAMMAKLKQQEEGRCFTDIPEENVLGKKGWPRGMKRKWRRKNHCWTYIKKRKPSTEDKNDKETVDTESEPRSEDQKFEEAEEQEVNQETHKKKGDAKEDKTKKVKNITPTNIEISPKVETEITLPIVEVRQKRKYVRKKIFTRENIKQIRRGRNNSTDSVQSVIDCVAKSEKCPANVKENTLVGRKPKVLYTDNVVPNSSVVNGPGSESITKKKRKISMNSSDSKSDLSDSGKSPVKYRKLTNKSAKEKKIKMTMVDNSEKINKSTNPKVFFKPQKKINIMRKELLAKIEQEIDKKPKLKPIEKGGNPIMKKKWIKIRLELITKIEKTLERTRDDLSIPKQNGPFDENFQNSLTKSQRIKMKKNLNQVFDELVEDIDSRCHKNNVKKSPEVNNKEKDSSQMKNKSGVVNPEKNENVNLKSMLINNSMKKDNSSLEKTKLSPSKREQKESLKQSPKKQIHTTEQSKILVQKDIIEAKHSLKEEVNSLEKKIGLPVLKGNKKVAKESSPSKKKIISLQIKEDSSKIGCVESYSLNGKNMPSKNAVGAIIVSGTLTEKDISNSPKKKLNMKQDLSSVKPESSNIPTSPKKRIPVYNQERTMPKSLKGPIKKVNSDFNKSGKAKMIFLKPVDSTMKRKLELAGHTCIQGHQKKKSDPKNGNIPSTVSSVE